MADRCPTQGASRRKRIHLDPALYRAGGRVFLITICTNDRHPWFAVHPSLADAAVAVISGLAVTRGTTLHAWCVMPDHVHLLVEDSDVVRFVHAFKGRLTVHARRVGPERRLWQRSFHDHALRSAEGLVETARYVLYNPVRAGIVAEVAGYRWSGSTIWPDRGDWV